jgi:ribonuclease Z
VGAHSVDFALHVAEFGSDRLCRAARFAARQAFTREETPCPAAPARVALQEEAFRVEAVALDHGIPSLAFCLREPVRVNVWRGVLEQLGLPVGPWLAEAKRAVRQGLPGETEFAVHGGGRVTLDDLSREALRIGPGQSVAYVTDAAATDANIAAVADLARDADQLFIEAVFLERDRALAEATRHLTAADAGRLARLARAKHLQVFHHSARYLDDPEALRREASAAFADSGPDSGAFSDVDRPAEAGTAR